MRTLIHNQEGIALGASLLMILASGWLAILWYARASYPNTIPVSLACSLSSWLLLTWSLRRQNMDNLLVGSIKEARWFFAIIFISSAVFFCLYIWRFGTNDPLQASHSLLELERLRDTYSHGYLVEFLKQPGWKFSFAVIGLLAIGLRLRALRESIRGVAKRAPTAARRIVYVLTAVCAFTFGGGLHDGAISRVEPVLKERSDEITEGYARAVEKQLPSIIRELAHLFVQPPQQTLQPLEPPQHRGTSQDLAIRLPVADLTAPPPPRQGPVEPPEGPPGPKDPKSPLSPGGGGALGQKWTDALHDDLQAVTNRLRLAEPSAEAATDSRAFRTTPKNIDIAQVRALDARPVYPSPAPSTGAEDADLNSFLDSGLEYVLDSKVPETYSLLEVIDGVHPFHEQLSAVTSQLVDAPVQDSLRELVADVLSAAIKDVKTELQVFVSRALEGVQPDSPLSRLKALVSKFRTEVNNTVYELNSPLRVQTPYVSAASESMRGDFRDRWDSAASRLPDIARAKAGKAYLTIEKIIQELPLMKRAATYTELSTDLKQITPSGARGYEPVADVLESIEARYIGAHEIRTAIAQAVEKSKKDKAAWRQNLVKLFDFTTKRTAHPPRAPNLTLDGTSNNSVNVQKPTLPSQSEYCCLRCTEVDGVTTSCAPYCGPECATAR